MTYVPFIMFGLYAAIMAGIVSRALIKRSRVLSKLAAIASDLGLEPRRKTIFLGSLQSIWNGMKVTIDARRFGKQSAVRTLRTLLQTDLPGRLYIRNRTSPPIRRFANRNLLYWKTPPAVSTLSSADLSAFAAGSEDAGIIMKLMASPAVRQLLQKNIIEADGELVLEGGKLQVLRFTRANLQDTDSAITDRVREMVRQEWDLIRTVLATLDPQLHISERQELALHCPFCKNELLESRDLMRCSLCGALHHTACWSEHGRCSTFGCSGSAMPFVKESVEKLLE